MNLRPLILALLLAVLASCSSGPPRQESSPPILENEHSGIPPEALNPDVTQSTIQKTICIAGYTASVRPSSSFTNGAKDRLMRDQGLSTFAAADFELDHRIPLALGGHPRSPTNLALQRWEGEDGAKKKDRLERKLQRLVCAGKMMLDDARRAVYLDWHAAYRVYGIGP